MDKSERVFKIPEFEYFDMGGKYSGNKRGTSEDDFNYHIIPKDDIRVEVWYGVNCFDLSEIIAEQVFEKTRDGYHSMLDWIEEFLKQNDSEFIYRPHPSENNCERLEEIEKKYPNFHINRAYSVKQWAKISDRVNLWISTSNAEICSLGVDYSIIRPYPIPELFEMESLRNEEYVTTLEEFIDLNTNIPEPSRERVRARLDKLSYFYDYDESKPAFVRIADCLEAIYKSESGQKFKFKLSEKIKSSITEKKTRHASRVMEKQLAKLEKLCHVFFCGKGTMIW